MKLAMRSSSFLTLFPTVTLYVRGLHLHLSPTRYIRPFSTFSHSNSLSSSISSLSSSSLSLQWPISPLAKCYRISSRCNQEENSHFYSIINTKTILNDLIPGKSYEITVTPIGFNGEEIMTERITKTIEMKKDKEVITPILTELSRLDIRVGKILDIQIHPEADTLYIESVDVGESTPRTIVSGLVKYCSRESLLNRSVIVLCNLKPRALKGITSHGMLLCASHSDHTDVDPLSPPTNSPVGTQIAFEGHLNEPGEPGNRVTKAFERVVADLITSEDGVATYQGKTLFQTPLGPCTSRIKKGKIS